MKLEKFDKNRKGKIIVTSIVLGLFLIIGGVYLFRSHAIFEEHKTFDVIFGKVPPFKKKEKDLELAILVDGTSVSEVPTDKDYRVRVECDTDEISGSWDYTNWYANISGHVTKPVICTIIFESIYDNITVDGESRNTFPEKGDYQVNMSCSNVTSGTWNSETWTPTVTGVNKSSSCDVTFKSTNNVITKITFDGEERESYPSKEETNSVEITCTNGSTGEWDYEKWTVKKINNVTNDTTCEIKFSSLTEFYKNVSLGDYVAYTPNSTSYEISAESTGYSLKQEINPSKLNLWRVIKKSNDGTIEIISENVSGWQDSKIVWFNGNTGYRKFVGTLNDIASAYETNGITNGSRHIGGTSEQEVCGGCTSCEYVSNYSADTPDTLLIKNSIGTLIARDSSGMATKYWLASRYFDGTYYNGRVINVNGTFTLNRLVNADTSKYDNVLGAGIRPIVVLKSNLTATQLEDKTDTNQNKTFKQWKVN